MSSPIIGVIGGSGLYQMAELQNTKTTEVETPYGKPSAPLIEGQLEGARMLFLPRHGLGHRFLPHEINYRANLFALKKLGAECVIAVSAVGSMKEELAPGHIAIPDQFYDNTYRRISSFFGDGIAVHVQYGNPICPKLSAILCESAIEAGATTHKGGTYICIEGPQFSTRAESNIYRQWGVSIIGMTNATESKLAREAELPYATLALVTDYDCWHVSEEEVSVDAVLNILRQNATIAQQIIKLAARRLVQKPLVSAASQALRDAIMTDPSVIPAQLKRDLKPLIGKYIPA